MIPHLALATAAQRMVGAAEMFGDRSLYAVPSDTAVATPVAAVVGDPMFQILAILLLLCIALLVRGWTDVCIVADNVIRGRLSDDFESGRRDAVISDGFAKTVIWTGAFAAAVFVSKYETLWLPAEWMPVQWLRIPAAAGIVVAVAAVVALYERTMLAVVGAVVRNREFVELLLLVKRSFFAASVLLISPVVLLSSLSGVWGDWWFRILAVECCILAFLFLKETLTLFLRKKVPIFQWFLYLCAVEAFPLSLVAALAARLR